MDTLKVAENGRMFIEDFGYIGQEKSSDPTVDIYMLGSVIYYALTGEPVPAINRRSGRDAADLAPLYELHIPDYAKEAITKALSISKTDRYLTVKGFADHLYNQAFIDVTETASESKVPVQSKSSVKGKYAPGKRDVSGKGPLVSDKRPAKKTTPKNTVPKNTAAKAGPKKRKSQDIKTLYDTKTGRFLVRNTNRKSVKKRRNHSFVIFAVLLIIILNISSVFRSMIKTLRPEPIPDPVPDESYMTTTKSLRYLTFNDTSYYAPVTLSELTGEGWETDRVYYESGDDKAGGTDGEIQAAPDDFADPKGGTYKALLHSGNFNLELTLYAPPMLTGSRVEDLPANNLYLYRVDGTDDDMKVINDVGIGNSVIEIMVSFGLHRNINNIFDDFEIHNELENSSVSFTFKNLECDSVNISYDLDSM